MKGNYLSFCFNHLIGFCQIPSLCIDHIINDLIAKCFACLEPLLHFRLPQYKPDVFPQVFPYILFHRDINFKNVIKEP